MTKNIQVLKPKFRVDECLAEIRECLEIGWTGGGFKTVEMEEKWSEYTGHSNSHFVNSNTSGLHLALYILKEEYGFEEGDEVITTPLTFVSANIIIYQCGLKPVFCDVDETLCMNPEVFKSKITSKTKAAIFVGMGGNASSYELIRDICDKNGIFLILDAAHMAGSRLDGVHIGSTDTTPVVVYSFQAVKNLPTADSGMICFKDAKLDQMARKLSWLGISKDTYSRSTSQGTYKWAYSLDHLGFKYNGNSIVASLALVGLKYLDADNAYRRQLAQWYKLYLKDNDCVRLITHQNECETSQHLIQIELSKRDEVMLALHECNIFPGVHYTDNTTYAVFEDVGEHCSVSRRMSDRILSLPCHLEITQADVKYICEILNEITTGSNC